MTRWTTQEGGLPHPGWPFPEATWVAIGLARMPDEQDAWVEQGLHLEVDEVLTTQTLPRQAPLPEGYTVRRLSGQDWAQSVGRSVPENDRTQEHDPRSVYRSLGFAPDTGNAQAYRKAPR